MANISRRTGRKSKAEALSPTKHVHPARGQGYHYQLVFPIKSLPFIESKATHGWN